MSQRREMPHAFLTLQRDGALSAGTIMHAIFGAA
jgi:hypothetical protein